MPSSSRRETRLFISERLDCIEERLRDRLGHARMENIKAEIHRLVHDTKGIPGKLRAPTAAPPCMYE